MLIQISSHNSTSCTLPSKYVSLNLTPESMNIIILWKISTDLDVWQHKHSYLIPWMIKLKLSAYFPTKPSYWLTGLQFALSIVLVCVHLAGSLGGAVTDFTAGGLECSSLGGGWISTTNLCTTQKSLYSTGGLLSEGAEPVWPPPRGAGHHRSHVRCGEWVGGQPTPHSGLFCCVLFYHKMYHFYLKINLLASTPHKGKEAHLKKIILYWENNKHEKSSRTCGGMIEPVLKPLTKQKE